MHLHWLSHVLARIRRHARMSMLQSWVYTGRRLVCGHHLASPSFMRSVCPRQDQVRVSALPIASSRSQRHAAGRQLVEQQSQSRGAMHRMVRSYTGTDIGISGPDTCTSQPKGLLGWRGRFHCATGKVVAAQREFSKSRWALEGGDAAWFG